MMSVDLPAQGREDLDAMRKPGVSGLKLIFYFI